MAHSERILYFNNSFICKDNQIVLKSSDVLIKHPAPFKAMHMASSGYWEKYDESKI